MRDTTALGHVGVTHIVCSQLMLFHNGLDEGALAHLLSVVADESLENSSLCMPAPATVERHFVDVLLHAGVTDPTAIALGEAARLLSIDLGEVSTGRHYEIHGTISAVDLERLTRQLLGNQVIERWNIDSPIDVAATRAAEAVAIVEFVPMINATAAELDALNKSRWLHLDPAEMLAVQSHYRALGREPRDLELETLAQTWSEHCSHKTFRALIADQYGNTITPLLRQLRDCTNEIDASFVVSSFVGNAGVVQFSPDHTLALKAETHNHPSAIEPFGGANTGVGGVIRDILGMTAHRPVACTNILCFGPADLDPALVPDGALHPLRIRSGVVAGIADYGNKIGLPTVAGAVLYDPAYTANPLVFAGCIGEAPADMPAFTGPHQGDRVIVLGGRTGRDGVRGATFSSGTMDATTGAVAGASVQIGDPITEKLLIDALAERHDLFTAITDCGAGGLSSAIGEMAEGIGADVELMHAPLKYPGLAPWEIWLSEAQERMVVASSSAQVALLREVCERHGVEVTDLGEFTGTGRLVVRYNGSELLDMDTAFLHDGRPQRSMKAVVPTPDRSKSNDVSPAVTDLHGTILALLAHPNLASKANVIRRYDHEIRGTSLVRPLTGPDGNSPSDGVVMAHPTADHGYAIGIGVNPWYGITDAEYMAHAVVDEAMRSVVAVGADPDRVALLDNFSWGDPRRPETLGELVAAVQGCCDAARAFNAPFVSGKDSLNNEYMGSDGQRHAVPPTLVITAVAEVPDANVCVTTDGKQAGNVIVMLGRTLAEFGGSHLAKVLDVTMTSCVPSPDIAAPVRYRALHRAIRNGLVESCHDIAEGGLAVAVCEMFLGGTLGVSLTDLGHTDAVTALFSESQSRLLCEVQTENFDAFLAYFPEAAGPVTVLGTVTNTPLVQFANIVDVSVTIAHAAHHSTTGRPT